jgi:hypothetical protein
MSTLAGTYAAAVSANNAAGLEVLKASGQMSAGSTQATQSAAGAGLGAAALGLFSGLVNLASKSFTFHKARRDVQQTSAGATRYESAVAPLRNGHGLRNLTQAQAQSQNADAKTWLQHQDAKTAKNWKKFLLGDVGSAGNGLLRGSVSTAAAATKLGAHTAAAFTKAVVPGVGIATGLVGIGFAAKSVFDEYQASKKRSTQAAAISDAHAEALKSVEATTNLKEALANVTRHAGLSQDQASRTSRWSLASSLLTGLASATAIVSNILTLTGVGAPAGLALACVSGAISAGALVCAARQVACTRARTAETEALKEAVRNGTANPATNRVCAVVELVSKLAQPGADRDTATQFLKASGMPADKVEALQWACEGETITVDHAAVGQLQRFFGL